ncbi:MAG: TRAP transporter small permease [Deltaproteobacteria bacterium]|nr:TRAP transporter small permease [Deltaproteobacteria bacterium]
MRKNIQRLTLYVSYLGMILLIPMMLLTTTDVLGRAIWSRPIYGSVELSSYMLAVFILLGVAYTHQVKGHVRVSMLTSRLPERASLALDLVTIILSLFIIGLLIWQGWVVGMEERAVSDMLRVPQRPFKLLVSVGAFLLWLELIIDLFATIKQITRRV